MTKHYLAQAIAATGLILTSSVALADTSTDNLDISLTIQAACTILSVTDVADTVALGTSGTHSSSGTVSVTCNSGHNYTVAMGSGLHVNSGQRNVNDGLLTNIPYQIYRGAAVWGSRGTTADATYEVDAASANANDVNGSGTGLAQSIPYQVDFTLAGTEPAGVYTDTVLVTLEF